MDPSQRTAGSRMPALLSLLWVFILFTMTFADTRSFMYPGFLKEVLTGSVGGVHITPGFLVAAAVLTEIPSSPRSVPRSCKRHAHLIAQVRVLPGAPTLSHDHPRRSGAGDPRKRRRRARGRRRSRWARGRGDPGGSGAG